jgi:uncharacterized membrane protein
MNTSIFTFATCLITILIALGVACGDDDDDA